MLLQHRNEKLPSQTSTHLVYYIEQEHSCAYARAVGNLWTGQQSLLFLVQHMVYLVCWGLNFSGWEAERPHLERCHIAAPVMQWYRKGGW